MDSERSPEPLREDAPERTDSPAEKDSERAELPVEEDSERAELLASVKFGLTRFFVALKTFSLYPDTNPTKDQTLASLTEWFEAFLREHGKLHLEVEPGQLVFSREPVYQDKPGEQSLVFPLFRDGVQWLEFEEGLTADELRTFLVLMTHHRIAKDDSDDDLVTAIWEADFTNIKYKSANTFWDSEPLADLSTLRVADYDWQETQGSMGYGHYGLDYGAGGGAGFRLGAAPTHGSVAGERQDSSSPYPPDSRTEGGGAQSRSRTRTSSDPDLNFGVTGGSLKAKPITDLLVEAALEAENAWNTVEYVASEDGQVVEIEVVEAGTEDAFGGALEGDGTGEGEGDSEGAGEGEGGGEAGSGRKGRHRRRRRPDPKKHVRKQLDFWTITPEDEEQIKLLVSYEEQRENIQDSLELCLELIRESSAADIDPLSEFLAEIIKIALSRGQFTILRVFLEAMTSLAAETTERGRFVETLKHKIGTSDCLTGLTELKSSAQDQSQAALSDLQAFILLLPPQASDQLILLLGEIKDQTAFKFLLPLAAILILRLGGEAPAASFASLPLIVLVKLMKVIEALADKSWGAFPLGLFLGFSRHHSPQVRTAAVRAMLKNNPDNIRYVLHLLNDPETVVNGLLCDHFEKHPSQLGERVLLGYLQESYSRSVDGQGNLPEDRLFNCYRALGRCASPESMSFLADILMQKNWKSFIGLGDISHRQGAAMALMLMPGQAEAAKTLQKAAKSPFRQVRQAVLKAEEEIQNRTR